MGVCDSVVTIYEGKKTAQLDITPELTREKGTEIRAGRQVHADFHEELEAKKEAEENVEKTTAATEKRGFKYYWSKFQALNGSSVFLAMLAALVIFE